MDFIIVKFLNHFGGNYTGLLTNLVSSRIFLSILFAIIALIIYICDKGRYKKVILALVLAIMTDLIITEGLLKHVLLPFFSCVRSRPYLAHPNEIKSIGVLFKDSSFPSGHMSGTLAAITVLFFHYKKYWPLMLVFILFMAFARMHNGMHYPSDVLAGAILGIGYGAAAIFILG